MGPDRGLTSPSRFSSSVVANHETDSDGRFVGGKNGEKIRDIIAISDISGITRMKGCMISQSVSQSNRQGHSVRTGVNNQSFGQ